MQTWSSVGGLWVAAVALLVDSHYAAAVRQRPCNVFGGSNRLLMSCNCVLESLAVSLYCSAAMPSTQFIVNIDCTGSY